MNNIKNDFPIFNNYPNLVYLDNGASTQKPQILIDAITEYYSFKNSNVGRGVYQLAELSDNALQDSRKTVAKFINTNHKNIIFTSGCTDSINQASYLIGQILKPKQKIILSIFEHHANILPWQRLAKEYDLELIFIEDESILNNPELLDNSFWENIGLIAITHVSNVTGQIHPIEKWCNIAHSKNIYTLIDGAQGIVSQIINVEQIKCDFYTFSAHKLYGPMGVGVLYISNNILKMQLTPYRLGGGIVEESNKNNYYLIDGNEKFEAGTPNVADIYAFSKVIDYLNKQQWNNLISNVEELHYYLIQELNNISELSFIRPTILKYSHIVSFNIKGIHSHDVGTFLAQKNIAVRVGKHCTHPLHDYLKINSSIRVSLGIYNNKQDIDILIKEIINCIKFFKG